MNFLNTENAHDCVNYLLTVTCTLFVLGDLLYIDVVTLEDVQVNITASTGGFFVNRSVFQCGISE